MADQGAEGLLSPYLRRKRFGAARPYLSGNVLDFGCGSGGLAEFVPADSYIGVDVDAASLHQARLQFPSHKFVTELPDTRNVYDCVVSLAVIEHVADPAEFLRVLAKYLTQDPNARLVTTTPHPSVDWLHKAGAKIGLFSKSADEEHQDSLDRRKLEEVGSRAGLKLSAYQRFLFGANQIAVFERLRS